MSTPVDELGNDYYDLIADDADMSTTAPERTGNGHQATPAPVVEVPANAPNGNGEQDPYTDVPPPEDEPEADTRPMVEIKKDLAELERSLIAEVQRFNAAADNPVIYARSDKMVEVARDRFDGGYRIAELSIPAFRSVLSGHCRFYKMTSDGKGGSFPAEGKVSASDLGGLYDRLHTMDLPELKKFTQCPVYDRNGRLHSKPGYSHEIGAFLHFPEDTQPMPPVDDAPTQGRAERAARWLKDELLSDFLFASESGPAGVLGLMLTPMCVELIHGPRPLIGFDAPEAGSGKTLLAKVSLWHVMPDMPLPNASESKSEFEKSLTSQARKGRPVMAFDNLNIVADSGPFAAAITGYPVWEARQLGVSENLTFPAPDAWVITANGLELSDENARRTLIVRINKHHPKYNQWRHPDIRAWVHENRGKIQAALATMVNAWLAAGRPAPTSSALPSFESWAYVIGGILEHAGVFGLLDNRSELANPERQAWAHFAHVMMTLQEKGYLVAEEGATASQIITAVNKAWTDDALDERPEQIDAWTRPADFGRSLKKRRGSALDQDNGLYLVAEAGRANTTLYRVEKIDRDDG